MFPPSRSPLTLTCFLIPALVLAGPAGQPRDWARFRSLLIPGARLIPSARRTPGTTTPVVWSAAEYIAVAGPGLERQGFFEREIHRATEAFGAVLHAVSTYDSSAVRTASHSRVASTAFSCTAMGRAGGS